MRTQLEATLRRMVADSTPPDVITFAGNGEPTMHPDFEAVIGDTIALRDALCPAAKVSVLSNATQIHRDSVRRALLRVDNNILKLDSAFDATVRRMNNPQSASYTVRGIVEAMKRIDGRMILQTMFLRGDGGRRPTSSPSPATAADPASRIRSGHRRYGLRDASRRPRSRCSNAMRRALLRVDNNILKLDSAFDATARLMNNPQSPAYTVRSVVEQMKGFDGRLTVQTMFLRGECDGQKTDNTTEEEVSAWLRLIEEIRPRQVMVYSLDRDTPCRTLEKVPREELQAIAARVEALGIPCSVA